MQKELGRYSGYGIELVTTTLVGMGIGYLLDRWLGTKPWLMVVGLVLGAVSGLWQVYKAILSEEQADKN